ncbi:MAG: hypothetical protein KDA92_19110 [Planctomycetales bacterium]|nr:hypothetical protein [Planctomycetales bacterium]
MPRSDLLALTADDLAAITNRGTVKRAQKELAGGEVTWEFRDDPTELVCVWSDGITCRFPNDKAIHDAVCSSGAVGVTRYIVRSVLAYQHTVSETRPERPALDDDQTGHTQSEQAKVGGVWDPGTISDDDLIAQYSKSAVAKARQRFEEGVLVELSRGAKPTARFLDEACTVRFLVPNDLRYVQADCAESLWPKWVPLAVWAFRHLPADQLAGLVSIQQSELPTPTALLGDLDQLLKELCRDGLSNVGRTWAARLSRVEAAMRQEGLVWPAELIAELLLQAEMYRQHDARFDPLRNVEVVGELLARKRAMERSTSAVPQPLIRGSRSDRPTEISGGRMVGVGLGVRVSKRLVTISAYLQDIDSGAITAVERSFADPVDSSEASLRSFSDLAETIVARGASLGNLATSQLLIKSGKRTPSGVLILPRTHASVAVNPQSFQWEQLKTPFAVEGFAQLAARLSSLPPSYLRPLRRAENLHVVSVAQVDGVEFDPARQCLTATVKDVQGDTAQLIHPFVTRGAMGFNALLKALQVSGDQVRFVCGHVRSVGSSLEIRPVSVIVDRDGQRTMLLPWASREVEPAVADAVANQNWRTERSVIEQFQQELQEALADLLLNGIHDGDQQTWNELTRTSERLGFNRLAQSIHALSESLHARSNDPHWDGSLAVRQILELCLFVRLAME